MRSYEANGHSVTYQVRTGEVMASEKREETSISSYGGGGELVLLEG